jgi:2-keto-4-pentenoate hydratase/2-oxohepta-3-ene-1,7-dioic acid hydratase in catechol pathway
LRLIRFQAGDNPAFGLVEDGSVRTLSDSPFSAVNPTGSSYPLSDVKLLAPCLPSKIFALAYNYKSHLGGAEPPKEPQIFLKVPSSVIGPGDAIVLPRGEPLHSSTAPGRVDEEAELVVVIGRRCRNVGREDALGYVFGYTCGNDVSARAWQKKDLSWWRAKSSDTFAPIGPAIVTDFDGANALITARINGREVQRCMTEDLFFDIPALIEWISASVTLEPGDLIFTGTAGSPAELHPGDVVEVEIEGIGVLSNPVVG